MKRALSLMLCAVIIGTISGCGEKSEFTADVKPATEITAKTNSSIYSQLDFSNC